MTISIHIDKIEVSFPGFTETQLKTLEVYIMSANADLIVALTAQINKSTAEINAKITSLEAAISNGEDLSGPLAALKDAVNANDAIIPDAPPVSE